MRTTKLITGIICMVLTAFVLFQSCAAGLGNALSQNGEVSGTAGALLAFFMLAGGIIQVATRNSTGKGGSIAAFIVFALAAVIGFANAGSYSDLNIWATWCLILGIINLICVIKSQPKE